ncbi:MAG: 2-keto-3-deoxy-D-arabino-heptulosonate-7-phosphate synthase I beta, partial [uncultured Solirubrobacteraceae bacterium]
DDRHEADGHRGRHRARHRAHRGMRRPSPPVARRRGDGHRRDRRSRARGPPRPRRRVGRRAGRSHLQALQARVLAAARRRAHGDGDRRPPGGRGELRHDRRRLHRRDARADPGDRAHRARRGGDDVPRRRLQAAHVAVRLPGPRRGGAAPAQGGQGGDRPSHRHRADGRPRPRARPRSRRHDPDRRPQHAELHPPDRDRAFRLPGDDQARALRDARGAADGLRVRTEGGQPERPALRARDPHLRDGLPLHPRPHRRPGAPGDVAPAGDRRSQPRRRAPRPRHAAVAGRRRRGRRRDHRRDASEPRGGDLRRPPGARRRDLPGVPGAGRACRRGGGQGALGHARV